MNKFAGLGLHDLADLSGGNVVVAYKNNILDGDFLAFIDLIGNLDILVIHLLTTGTTFAR